MNCRSCDKELATGEEKMVAQWAFCEECFTALLEKKEVAKEQIEECCHLCKKALVEGQSKKVGLWNFCTDCFGDLNKPARLNVSLSVAPEESKSKTCEPEEDEPEEIVVLKTVYVNCGQCGRRIPERGSKERKGEPYCPDCYFANQEAPPPQAPVASQMEEPREVEAEVISAGKCMSCLNEGCELKMVKGFPLCSACLISDQNLALEIAKKRHKKRLEQLNTELD